MGFLERALSKLTISAYQDRELRREVGRMKAMYNPESIILDYKADLLPDGFLNSTEQSNSYQKVQPGQLEIKLIFDAELPGNRKKVDEQLAQLRTLCCSVSADTRQIPFLKIEWGKMNWNGHGYFAGRMASMSVLYSLFDRNATPLRAEVTLHLSSDESLLLQKSRKGLSTPKIGTLTVPDIPSLALIAMAAGVSYLSLAVANDLDSLNDVAPGDTLVTPLESEV